MLIILFNRLAFSVLLLLCLVEYITDKHNMLHGKSFTVSLQQPKR